MASRYHGYRTISLPKFVGSFVCPYQSLYFYTLCLTLPQDLTNERERAGISLHYWLSAFSFVYLFNKLCCGVERRIMQSLFRVPTVWRGNPATRVSVRCGGVPKEPCRDHWLCLGEGGRFTEEGSLEWTLTLTPSWPLL